MNELLKSIQDLIKSVAKQPMMALLLIIFLVLIWVQVEKLDDINETLVLIHKDNQVLHTYIVAEEQSTKEYIVVMNDIRTKIELILSKLQ